MTTDPPADLVLAPLGGQAHPLREWLTTFHLVLVALDPYTNESAWILETAGRILRNFEQADCRIAWLVASGPDDARRFLGPWADEILTFADPDRTAVKALGLERLPAFVHLGMDATIVNAAEGWRPEEWAAVSEELARMMSWRGPHIPAASDPSPFQGTPALG